MSFRQLQDKYPHLNLRWNMAQMDRMMLRAREGATADVIAFEFDTTAVEILALAKRNGFFVKPARLAPRLASVTTGAER